MKKLSSIIELIDIFDPTINFNIHKGGKLRSSLGGFATLILTGVYIYFFVKFGDDFFNSKNPIILSRSINDAIYPKFELRNNSDNKFYFGWRLVDVSGNIFNASEFFRPEFIYNSYIKDELIEYKVLSEFSNCSNFDDSQDSNKIYKNLNKSASFNCLNLTFVDEAKYYLGGNFNSDFNAFFSFKLFLNDNIDPKLINKNYINDNLNSNNLFIEFFLPEVSINQNNYKIPIKNGVKYFNNYFSKDIRKWDIITLNENIVQTDSGILFENLNNQTSIGFKQMDSTFSFSEKDIFDDYFTKEYYYRLEITYDRSYFYMTRKYMRFQDLLGNISGFMDLLLMFMNLFFSIYNQIRIDKYLSFKLIDINNKNNGENFQNIKIISKKNTAMDSNENIVKKDSFNDKNEIKIIPTLQNENNFLFNENDKIDKNLYDSKYKTELKVNKNLNKSNNLNLSKIVNIIEGVPKEISKKNLILPHREKIFDTEKIKNLKNHKLKKFEFNVFDYYLKKLCFWKKSHSKHNHLNIPKHVSKKINSRIDIVYYLRLTNHVKYLKKLFLNVNQRYLFKNIFNNIFYYNYSNRTNELELLNFDTKFEVNNAMVRNYYEKMNVTGSPSEMDEKLFDFLDFI